MKALVSQSTLGLSKDPAYQPIHPWITGMTVSHFKSAIVEFRAPLHASPTTEGASHDVPHPGDHS